MPIGIKESGPVHGKIDEHICKVVSKGFLQVKVDKINYGFKDG